MSYDIKVEDVEYLRHDGAPLLARLYRPQGAGPYVRSSSSIRTWSGASMNAILTPGRIVRGSSVKLAPRRLSSATASSMLSTRNPK